MTPAFLLKDAKLETILEAAPVGMLVVDQRGHIVFSNKQASVIFGYSVETLLGMTIDRLIPPPMRTNHHDLVSAFFGYPSHRVMGVGREVVGMNANGREIPLEIGLTPLHSNTETLAIAAVVDITERKHRETESTLARIVQIAMLPAEAPAFHGAEIAARSEPADAAGGDFYDYIPLSNGRLAVVIGDASGHGFAAALVTVAARSYVRACSIVEEDLPRILSQVNSLLLRDELEGRFVTLFYVSIDPSNRCLTYSGAGHTGFLFSANGELKQQLMSTGPPLGWFPEAVYSCEQQIVEPGDVLLLLTDGIEEAMAPTGENFGTNRLLKLVKTLIHNSSAEIAQRLHDAVHKFRCNADQHDDATVVVVKFRPQA